MLLAAIICAMVAFLIIGTMLPSYISDYRTSVRNRLYSSAFAMAEAGGEEAIWSAYRNRWDIDSWKNDGDWSAITGPDGDTYYVRRVAFDGVDLGAGYTGYAKVAVKEPVPGQQLEVMAQGIVMDHEGNDYLNQIIQVDTDQLKPFVGFIAKDSLNLGSGTILGAVNTNDYPTIIDALNNRDSDGVVGSLSTDNNSIVLSSSNQKTQANMIAFVIGNVLTGANVFSDAVSYNGTINNQTSNYTASFPSVDHPSASSNNGPGLF
ncbi:hypothetical protein [Cerasicoccus maritimus]|uniref:hypothetical protein n=1 Tax=Cerasicoccus maritimus TaxID=490089 RepID=UPI0028525C99|nr:hypothetical protein [Cerasicoccus maritimus]